MERQQWMRAVIVLVCIHALVSVASGDVNLVLDDLNITFSPPHHVQVEEWQQANVTMEIRSNGSYDNATLLLDFTMADTDIAVLEGDRHVNVTCCNVSVPLQVNGRFLGKTLLRLQVALEDAAADIPAQAQILQPEAVYAVHVLKGEAAINSVFNILLGVILAFNTMAFGCRLDLEVVKTYLRRPTPLLLGFCCQYIVMPLLAFGLGAAFQLRDEFAFGLMAIGSSPGGGPSNMLTLLCDGDVDLSITMTVCNSLAALGMMPLWLFTLGQYILNSGDTYRGTALVFPWGNLVLTILLILVPGSIGILISYFLRKAAKVISRFLRPVNFVIILVILGVGIYTNSWIFSMLDYWQFVVACMLLPYLGYGISFAVPMLLRRTRKEALTIMIETGVQNSALAIVLLRSSLPQPDGYLAAGCPTLVTFFYPLPLLLGLLARFIYRSCTKKAESSHLELEEKGNEVERGREGSEDSGVGTDSRQSSVQLAFPARSAVNHGFSSLPCPSSPAADAAAAPRTDLTLSAADLPGDQHHLPRPPTGGNTSGPGKNGSGSPKDPKVKNVGDLFQTPSSKFTQRKSTPRPTVYETDMEI